LPNLHQPSEDSARRIFHVSYILKAFSYTRLGRSDHAGDLRAAKFTNIKLFDVTALLWSNRHQTPQYP